MDKIKVAIVEDEAKYIDEIRSYLNRFHDSYGVSFAIQEFGDGIDILDGYETSFDLIFLDINMKNKDGMSTAREIRKKDNEVLIVFVTSLAQYAVEGYEVNAFDFILKPISYGIFEPKLRRMLEVLKGRKRHYYLLLEKDGVKEKVDTDDVLYIEVQNHLLIVRTSKGKFEKWGKLKDYETELADYNFVKINQSYLVNMKKIDSVSGSTVSVGGTQISISRTYKKDVMEEIVQFIEAGY